MWYMTVGVAYLYPSYAAGDSIQILNTFVTVHNWVLYFIVICVWHSKNVCRGMGNIRNWIFISHFPPRREHLFSVITRNIRISFARVSHMVSTRWVIFFRRKLWYSCLRRPVDEICFSRRLRCELVPYRCEFNRNGVLAHILWELRTCHLLNGVQLSSKNIMIIPVHLQMKIPSNNRG